MAAMFHLQCPFCSGREVEILVEVTSINDYIGSNCTRCGYTFTEEEIQRQLDEFSAQRIRDILQGGSG